MNKKLGRKKKMIGGCSLHSLYIPYDMANIIKLESNRTGASESELIRRAIDRVYKKIEIKNKKEQRNEQNQN